MDETQSIFFGKGMHLAHLNVRSLLGSKKSDMFKTQIYTKQWNRHFYYLRDVTH